MSTRRACSMLFSGSVLLLGIAAVRWQGAVSASFASAPDRGPNHSATAHGRIDSDSLSEFVDYLVSNDPFRLSNAPSNVRFDLGPEGGQSSPGIPPMAAPRPVLVLKAIVGGPPWQALIDGIPGQPAGTIAEQGKRFNGFLVKTVTADSVVVQGPDTSWVLSFRKRS